MTDLFWMVQKAKKEALTKFASLIRANGEELHWLEAVLTGKDYGFSSWEVNAAADLFDYYANMIDKFPTEVLESRDDVLRYTIRQPYGVCAAICPFNGPLITLAMKAAPALAAGNTMVVKTSEANPFSTLFLASLSREAGIPPGTLNCLTGGPEAGSALASHARVRKISFTGSVAVGRMVQAVAARSNLKSVTLELGGKSPLLVFPDADLAGAVEEAALFLLMNGQGCALPTRLLVHRDVADEVLGKLKALLERRAHGLVGKEDPLAPGTRSSPLYNHRQKEVVMDYIESGKREATLVTGGDGFPGSSGGCYVDPALFVDPAPDARVLGEEIFGPVMVAQTFGDEEEAVGMANDTEFGLAAYLWTRDLGRVMRLTRRLEAGTVTVNGAGGFSPDTPMGGWKQSGQGLENGREGMLDWTQSKSVAVKG
ncbi:hypothetical protein N3K66_000227 [Trichothecium roseum]|uniref:Uncharacterized protein n=1 Tax=Trichothecium roseum TaxID=47278 RepID=A0ACC0VE13_9HYPO|nr:hypothetical protein N3K66_000227 [Trichothecium roseum]